MPIPTFDKMLHPLLAVAIAGPITRRIAKEAKKHFKLTADKCAARIPSGNSTFAPNRIGSESQWTR